MKMEQTVSTETSAIRTQTPGNYPKKEQITFRTRRKLKNKKSNVDYLSRHLRVYLARGIPATLSSTDNEQEVTLFSIIFILNIFSSCSSSSSSHRPIAV